MVAPLVPGGAVPTGLVAFAEGGVILGEAPLNAQGVALFVTNGLPWGADVVAAVYLGDPSNAPSLSNYVSQAVQPIGALTTLIGPTSPGRPGGPVTFSAIVSPTVGDNIPTGLVIFAEDGILLGEAPLNAAGVAVFVTDRLPLGLSHVAAAYLGDPFNAPSLSNYVNVKVVTPKTGKATAHAVKPRAIKASAVSTHPSGPKHATHVRKAH